MKNFNINKQERVEVMALFGYEMTPCQPLSFKRRGGNAVEVTELLGAKVDLKGGAAKHIFEVVAGKERVRLEFDSQKLFWYLSPVAA